MTDISVEIEGKNDPIRTVESRTEDQTLLEQSTQMDLEIKRPIDETAYNRDIARESQEDVVSDAKERVKNGYNNDRWRASLPKARAALANKRARMKAEGRNGKQGTPVPDLMTDIAKMMDERFEKFNVHLEDLKKIYPKADPLQPQGAVIPHEKALQEVPEHPNDIMPLPPKDAPKDYPLIPDRTLLELKIEPDAKRQKLVEALPQEEYLHQQQNFTRKFQKALDHMQFSNQELRDRAKADPSQGQRRDMQGLTPHRTILF